MIDGMMQDSIDQTLDDRVKRPVAAPRPASGFSVWNTIKAPVVGAAAGGVESGGFAADIVGAFGQVQAGYGAQADPSLLFSPDEQKKRREEGEAARGQVASGQAFSTEIGTGLRATARDMMPDPATSNVVENTLFGLGRFATKAVGYSVAAGPVAGAVLTGADEALTEAERLKAEGVDITTRTKVGAVAGLSAAAAVALPVAGKTIAQTTALVAASGPGAFIAQQAASKAILQHADYTKQADQFDPFDPVGLAVSTLVPAAFGAFHMRGGAKPAAPSFDPAAARALVEMGGNERKALRYDDPRLDAYAVTAAQREGIPPEALLAIKNAGERSGSSAATSPVGAKGIMQFMDATWSAYGKGDVRDPVANIDGAARYMKDLIAQYGGDVRAAIAHYNGGGKAGEAVRAGKAPPAAETRAYLDRADAYMAERGGEAAGRAVAHDPAAVDAARVQLVRDTVEGWNLKDPADIAAAQDHLAAVVRASDQLGAGDRVDVSSTIDWDTLQKARMLDDMVGRMESARADLIPEAGMAAEPGAVRTLRAELDQLRQSIPDAGEQAIKDRAKALQGGEDRLSYKEALAAARKEIGAAAAEHQGRIDALERQVETNRSAEQARQALDHLDQQIGSAKAAREALNAPPLPKQTALAARQVLGEKPAPKAIGEAGKAAGGGEPPVQPGFVRVYHGGLEMKDANGRWVMPEDRRYAEGYAAKAGENGRVFYLDIPETDPRLAKAFDDTGTSQKAPYAAFELRGAEAAAMKELSENPAAAGIPPLQEEPGGAPNQMAVKQETGASAAAASVDAQAAEIARLSPDMMVQLEGMDRPVRLADALEAVKAEAAREAADAPLLQAAAECFLRGA